MEGARWDRQKQCIVESIPQIFYDEMPIFVMTPVINSKRSVEESEDRSNYCEVPVYRALERKGVYNNIGESTNFVTYIKLKVDDSKSADHWITRGVALICQLND